MRAVTRVLIAAALAFGLGCAQTDWIDRTLVTVDVTGVWQSEGSATVELELKQQGSTVKGFLVVRPGTGGPRPIDGTVAGDVFRFRDSRGNWEGEFTVSGDEMNGQAVILFGGSRRPFSLLRVDSSAHPDSPRR